MLSTAKMEAYRRMSPEERWREVEALMTLAWRALREMPEEELARRFDTIRREREESHVALLAGLRRSG